MLSETTGPQEAPELTPVKLPSTSPSTLSTHAQLHERLRQVSHLLCSLSNYNNDFLERLGLAPTRQEEFDYKLADEIGERFNKQMNHDVFDSLCFSLTKDKGVFELPQLDQELTKFEQELGKYFDRIERDPAYRLLLDAYREQRSKEVALLVPQVFDQTERADFRLASSRVLHGIKLSIDLCEKNYVDIIEEILNEGLLPTPHGTHSGMDPNIQPIYGTQYVENTHGLAYFSFSPNGLAVFGDATDLQIYHPNLQPNSTWALHLKPEDLDADGSGLLMESYVTSMEDALEFRKRVITELRRREIPHILDEGYLE